MHNLAGTKNYLNAALFALPFSPRQLPNQSDLALAIDRAESNLVE